jgi:hypothetical protein
MGKVVTLILFGIIVSTLSLRLQAQRTVTESIGSVSEKYNEETVRNIANAGANVALNALTINVDETQSAQNSSLFGGYYSYFFERPAQDNSLSSTQVRVTAIGNYSNLVDTVVVLLTRPSFSRYAYFTNNENGIYFQTGDTIRGPAHTNGYFYMSGQPVFTGKVTSHLVYSSDSPYYSNPADPSTNPDFQGGTEWQVPTLTMPTEIPQDLIDASQSGGIYINNRYAWIEFQSDGTVKIAAKNTSTTPTAGEYTTYTLGSTNGVIYVKYTTATRPTVQTKGTVNGGVTLASSGSIKVTDNLICADNPLTNPNSDDMIGITAARNIIVTNSQADQDRTIQATIMTMNSTASTTTNFYVENYSGTRYGRLNLYGGLIQQSRGAVGTTGTEITRKGYLKDYRWDPRLQNMAPPYFPMLFVLRKIAWYD